MQDLVGARVVAEMTWGEQDRIVERIKARYDNPKVVEASHPPNLPGGWGQMTRQGFVDRVMELAEEVDVVERVAQLRAEYGRLSEALHARGQALGALELTEFSEDEAVRASRKRFERELVERGHPEVEVVLLLRSPSRAALERTHARYFKNVNELTATEV